MNSFTSGDKSYHYSFWLYVC